MKSYSIIIIGDEILLGQVTDTNSGAIARALGPMGFNARRTIVVADDSDQIRSAVEQCMADSDIVITTGGLGPTKDDITKLTLAKMWGCGLKHDESVLENVKRVFAARNLQLNDATRSQAMVPEACEVIQNRFGTAPIMWFERDGKALVSMPGVPFETVGMLECEVAPRIKQRFAPDATLLRHTMLVTGLPESALSQKLEEYEAALPPCLHLAYLPTPGLIRLRLDGTFNATDDTSIFDSKVRELKLQLGSLLLHDGDAPLAAVVLDKLRRCGMTMATAESCTGGTIASRITSVAGSSDCFMGGIVSYSNSVKANVLGVDVADIEAHGAVSEQVVMQMAAGACRVCGADCAVATSGIAGPGGGSAEKPVGTVWMAVCVRGNIQTRLFHFPGDRARVIERAVNEALMMLAGNLPNE